MLGRGKVRTTMQWHQRPQTHGCSRASTALCVPYWSNTMVSGPHEPFIGGGLLPVAEELRHEHLFPFSMLILCLLIHSKWHKSIVIIFSTFDIIFFDRGRKTKKLLFFNMRCICDVPNFIDFILWLTTFHTWSFSKDFNLFVMRKLWRLKRKDTNKNLTIV